MSKMTRAKWNKMTLFEHCEWLRGLNRQRASEHYDMAVETAEALRKLLPNAGGGKEEMEQAIDHWDRLSQDMTVRVAAGKVASGSINFMSRLPRVKR
jgi:hypothetical protein